MPLFAFWMAFLLIGAGLLLIGVAIGGAGVYRIMAPVVSIAESRATDATERLIGAWRDGYTVPAATSEPEAEPEPEVLGGAVLEFIEQFDTAGQAAYRAKVRRLLHDMPDMTDSDLVRRLERDRFRSNVLDEPYGVEVAA